MRKIWQSPQVKDDSLVKLRIYNIKSGLWLTKASFWEHLSHTWSEEQGQSNLQKLYGSLLSDKCNDIYLTSKLFGRLQLTAQPAYSGHFEEHLSGLWDGLEAVINILSTQSLFLNQIYCAKGANPMSHITNDPNLWISSNISIE